MKFAAQSIDFDVVPTIGTPVMVQGQRFELVEVRPYTNRAGEETTLLVWRSHCAACGEPYQFATGLRSKWPNRRCEACKAPGRPVAVQQKRRRAYG